MQGANLKRYLDEEGRLPVLKKTDVRRVDNSDGLALHDLVKANDDLEPRVVN